MSHGETKIEAVFLRALDIPSPQERAAYLQQACAGDDELRRRVERLLAAQPQVGSFLHQNAAAMVQTRDQPAAERRAPGSAPTSCCRRSAKAAWATVCMAEQDAAGQPHASPSRSSSRAWTSAQVIARFEAERQALALMDHPNIAKVLDAGATTDAAGRTSSWSWSRACRSPSTATRTT